jgi:Rieske Fe-S protein
MAQDQKENEEGDKSRRTFLKAMGIIGVGVLAIGSLRGVIQNIIPPVSNAVSNFPTLTIVSSSGKPINTTDIQVNNPTPFLFNYPLLNEPNFLLRLGDSSNKDMAIKSVTVKDPGNGNTFVSAPGVGPYNSVIASSAICQHLGCVPPKIHFYSPSSSSFPGMIHCSCHGSTYDPKTGFSIVTGPTQHPLPNTYLSYDSSSDTYKVTGMVGPTIYGHINDLSGGSALPSTSTTEVSSS